MSDGININNLEGAVKAFAYAADQNNDGKIDEKEEKLFNQFINGANLRQDEGLKVEKQKSGNVSNNDPKDVKKAQKEENKLYAAYFGKENIEQVKADEGEANRRVINAFKKLKGAQSPQMLNDAISGRPDMADYAGDAEGYKKALDNWADDVENALDKSIAQNVNEHSDNNVEKVIANSDVNTQKILESVEKLNQDLKEGKADILRELENVQDGVVKEIRTAKGQVIRAVFNNANRIVRVINDAEYNLHAHMDHNLGVQLDATYNAASIVMENSNENHEATRRNDDINHEITKTVLTHEIKRSEQQQKEIDAVSKRISDNHNGKIMLDSKTSNTISNMRQKIIESSVPHEKQMELLNHLANFTAQGYISGSELEAEEKYINDALNN